MTKEPETFSAFFSNAVASLKKAAEERFSKQVKSREKTLSELAQTVAKGERLRAFLESSVWKQDFQPFLADEAAKAQMRPWRPGDPITLEAFQAEHLFMSGKAWQVSNMLTFIGSRIKDGDEAAKQLKFEQEKLKRVH